MKAAAFEELLASVREVGAVRRGERKPSRTATLAARSGITSVELGPGLARVCIVQDPTPVLPDPGFAAWVRSERFDCVALCADRIGAPF